MSDEWYSDAALAKQAEAASLPDDAPFDVELLAGIFEPRVHATADQRCRCCGLDARPDVGGSGRLCALCISRGHSEPEAG